MSPEGSINIYEVLEQAFYRPSSNSQHHCTGLETWEY